MIEAAKAIALLDRYISYCEDNALDLRDIGGRNADAKAEKFEQAARDLMDVKRVIKVLIRERAAASIPQLPPQHPASEVSD
jgi:hypothetical protein